MPHLQNTSLTDARAVSNDHAELLRVVEDVASRIATRTPWDSMAIALLEAIDSHFEHEESSWLYRTAPDAHPEATVTLRQLKEEHPVLHLQLQTIVEAPEPNAELMLLWIRRIRAHEAEESRLLQDLVYKVEGGSG